MGGGLWCLSRVGPRGNCTACFTSATKGWNKEAPVENPFLMAKAEREADGTLWFEILRPHEGLPRGCVQDGRGRIYSSINHMRSGRRSDKQERE